MTWSRQDIELLREGWDFEAKLAAGADGQGTVPRTFWETYSAMANTEGGVVLLGARESGDGRLALDGLGDPDKVERDLWNALNDRQKVSANVLGRTDVERVDIDGATLLLIRIPKARREDRPVFLNGSWERNTFVRVHDGDRRLDQDTARRMLADAQPQRDARILTHYGLADMDVETVRRYREVFAARRPEHPFLRHEGIEFLCDIGAWGKDRERGEQGPTVAGMLMLGKERALRELYPNWHLSYRELPAEGAGAGRWVDRVHPDGTWEANVFGFYLRVLPKLHAGVKTPFALDNGQFRRDEGPVHAALREALVNTLVHADYEGPTGVRVIRKPAGFEFLNPGLPLVSVEQVWRGGVSMTRNPLLQGLFGAVQLGEREGSGGPAIRMAWTSQHWQAPVLRTDVENGETHLELRQASLLPPASLEALRERWGQRFVSLGELGHLILATAHAEGHASHSRIRELTDAHARDITLKLQELVRGGFLQSSGERRATVYSLSEFPDSPSGDLPLFPRQTPVRSLGDGRTPGAEQEVSRSEGFQQTPPGIPQSIPQSPTAIPQSGGHQAGSGVDGATAARGRAVDRVASTSWASAQDVRLAILTVCEGKFVSVADIALALHRKASTILQNYVSRMVQDGLLEQKHPGAPRHPDQAYRTVHKRSDAE